MSFVMDLINTKHVNLFDMCRINYPHLVRYYIQIITFYQVSYLGTWTASRRHLQWLRLCWR